MTVALHLMIGGGHTGIPTLILDRPVHLKQKVLIAAGLIEPGDLTFRQILFCQEQKVLIRAKYNKQFEDLNRDYTNATIERTRDALRLEYENRIAELAIQGENTLALEVEMKQRESGSTMQLKL